MSSSGSSLYYKSLYDINSGGRKYLDDLAGYNPADYIRTKLNLAGRQSRDVLNLIGSGADVSKYMGAELGAIKGEAARDKEVAARRIAGGLAYARQPGVAAAQVEQAMRARDLDTGQQVVGAARGVRSEALSTLMQAKAQQQAARQALAQLELEKREAANRAYLDSFKQTGRGLPEELLRQLILGRQQP